MITEKRRCPHCEKEIEFEKPQQFGGHVTNCSKNPKKKENSEKRVKTKHDNKFKIYVLKCLNCEKEYELEISIEKFEKGKYRKCCCKKCSAQYSSKFINHNDKKYVYCQKCGKKIQVKLNDRNNKNCENCGNYTSKKGIINKRIINGYIKTKRIKDHKIICKFCGEERCKDSKI